MGFEIEDTEQILRFSHFTIERAPDGVVWVDSEARIRRVNDALCKRLGYSREELTSMTIHDIVPDYPKEVWSKHWEEIRKNKVIRFETRQRGKEGRDIPVEITANFIEFEGKEYACGFSRDITEQIRTQLELREREEHYRRIFEGSNDAIFLVDPSTDQIIDANPEACRMLGYSHDELIRTKVSTIHANEMPRLLEFAATVGQNGSGRSEEFHCLTKSGVFLPAGISASAIRFGGVSYLLVHIRNLSERKKAEEDLRNAFEEIERLKNRLQAENIYLQEEIKLSHNFDEIISRNEDFKRVLRKIEQVGSTNATVLILGETGTGKELVARAIHAISNRRARPLVKVNCAALPAALIESELFGHEKGAFTGAIARKAGRFELADGGTIFLDEVGELPLELQAKLLRVLQEGEFERLGSSSSLKVDVRVIAATSRNLEKAVEGGVFRQDLFYRLNVFPIQLPSLRERKDDIPLLVRHFVKKYCLALNKNIDSIPQRVMDFLIAHSWPGNVRELENIVERAVILTQSSTLFVEELNEPQTVAKRELSPPETLQDVEREHIVKVLKACNGMVDGPRGAAVRLGLPPSTVRDRMNRLGIKRQE